MQRYWFTKSMKFILLSGALLFTLVACNANDDNNDNANGNGNGMETENIDNNNVSENDNGMIDDNNDNNNNANGDNRYDVAEKAANKVSDLPEVADANVLVTDNDAYVAAQLKNNNNEGKITRDLERKISKQVKSTDQNIDNVYVSTNPDFVDRVNDYVNKVQQGKPVQGFGDEFAEVIRRVFPNQR
jgi:spore cortex protein